MRVKHHGRSISYAYRRAAEGNPVKPEQLYETLNDYDNSRGELESAAALLRLSGPDDLGDLAESVRSASDVLGQFSNDPDGFDGSLRDLAIQTEVFTRSAQVFTRTKKKRSLARRGPKRSSSPAPVAQVAERGPVTVLAHDGRAPHRGSDRKTFTIREAEAETSSPGWVLRGRLAGFQHLTR